MDAASPHQLLALARDHQQNGHAAEAEALCQRVLKVQPRQAEALHLLGLLAHQAGDQLAARNWIERAIQIQPAGDFYCTLGLVLAAGGRQDDAIEAFKKAIEIQPGRFDAWANLGNALRTRGRINEAIAAYQRSAALEPNVAAVQSNLGVALKDAGRCHEAVAAFQKAAQLWPEAPGIWSNLGNAYKELGMLDEAKVSFAKVIALAPDRWSAYNNLGTVHQDAGELNEAAACYRKAMELEPQSPVPHSNLLYLMHFNARFDAAEIYREHVYWRERHAEGSGFGVQGSAVGVQGSGFGVQGSEVGVEGLGFGVQGSEVGVQGSGVEGREDGVEGPGVKKHIQTHGNVDHDGPKLRIGYVSPDFREHAVGRFMLPLLEKHDRRQFEIFCYSGSLRPADEMTGRLCSHADHWRPIAGLPDADVASMVRGDHIDILVDLTMHLAGSRLLVFAQEPAPVQATYLAYCGTTGLDTIDYRITDPHLDPPGQTDAGRYSERSIHIESYWCYQPPIELPEPTAPPSLSNGHITFGCFNNFAKASPQALETWCKLLGALPGSRLLLYAAHGAHRERVRAMLANNGVDSGRIEFVGPAPLKQYFEQYQRLDIALDPFPFAGGTTTCDALWMGVPVVTLAGQSGVGRGGVSILSHVGLPELIAGSADEYVAIARQLAADRTRLIDLRAQMRRRMRESVLMDAGRFAKNIEHAYCQMWAHRAEPSTLNPEPRTLNPEPRTLIQTPEP